MKKFGKLFAVLLSVMIAVTSLGIPAAAASVGTVTASKSTVGASAPTYRPIISKSPGTYYKQVTVKLSSRKGADIYYTTNGKTPTTKSTKYTGEFKITKSCTLKAIAVVKGKATSAATADYVIQVSKPTFSVEAGYYTKAQTVTVTPMDSKTVMYYTTDGSTPTTKSTKYTGPIKISKYTVLKVRAYKSGCLKSDVVTQEYNIYKASSTTTTDTSGTVTRMFKWNDGMMDWEYTLVINKSDYKTYYNKENYSGSRGYLYNEYVNDTTDNVWVKSIVDSFMDAADSYGYSKIQKLYMIISFCQSITYQTDKASVNKAEFPRYPLVTLYDMEGDCEDTAILMCAMLRAAGYDVMMLQYDALPGAPEGHMALGIAGDFTGTYYQYNGKNYYYIEPTATGWDIGSIPEGYDYATFWTIK